VANIVRFLLYREGENVCHISSHTEIANHLKDTRQALQNGDIYGAMSSLDKAAASLRDHDDASKP